MAGPLVQGTDAEGALCRALLIIIVPMVILQSVVAFVFMERHWNTVTRRLSAAVVQDISALIDVYRTYPQDKDRTQIKRIAQQRLGLVVDFLPVNDMPAPGRSRSSRCSIQTLSVQLSRADRAPVLDDTVGRSSLVEIRIKLDDTVMRIFAQRSAAYASNSEIFIFWMLGTSSILLIVAVLFLRNQIKTDPAAGGCRGKFRQGSRGAGFPPARRARGSPRGARLHGNEIARRAQHRAAHRQCWPVSATICAPS